MNQGRGRLSSIVPTGRQPGEHHLLKYRPEFCDQVREMAQDGMFPEEWCAHIGVSMSTLYKWCHDYPDFEEAVKAAWVLLAAYWARWVRENKANPHARVHMVMKMLERRLPSLWGGNARGHEDHLTEWLKQQRSPAVAELSPDQRAALSDDDLKARIAAYEARRKAEAGG